MSFNSFISPVTSSSAFLYVFLVNHFTSEAAWVVYLESVRNQFPAPVMMTYALEPVNPERYLMFLRSVTSSASRPCF